MYSAVVWQETLDICLGGRFGTPQWWLLCYGLPSKCHYSCKSCHILPAVNPPRAAQTLLISVRLITISTEGMGEILLQCLTPSSSFPLWYCLWTSPPPLHSFPKACTFLHKNAGLKPTLADLSVCVIVSLSVCHDRVVDLRAETRKVASADSKRSIFSKTERPQLSFNPRALKKETPKSVAHFKLNRLVLPILPSRTGGFRDPLWGTWLNWASWRKTLERRDVCVFVYIYKHTQRKELRRSSWKINIIIPTNALWYEPRRVHRRPVLLISNPSPND